MNDNQLDEVLRSTLLESAPCAVHERVRLHFDRLAGRLRDPSRTLAPTRNLRRRAWWLTGLGALATAAAVVLTFGLLRAPLRADIAFVGILATKETTLFSLVDSERGAKSGWVPLKQTFAGFTLSAYDPKGDVLTLTKDGAKTKIRLKDAKIENARMEIHGTVSLDAGEKLDIARATLVFDQENVFPLKNGVVVHITPQRMPDGNILYSLAYERNRADGTPERLSSPRIVTLPGKAFGVSIGSQEHPETLYGFSFTPSEEPTTKPP